MGFYPKHLRSRQHRRNMRLIATAALSGCIFREEWERVETGGFNYNGDPYYRKVRRWGINYADGKQSTNFETKTKAAAVYLIWWFQKQGLIQWAKPYEKWELDRER